MFLRITDTTPNVFFIAGDAEGINTASSISLLSNFTRFVTCVTGVAGSGKSSLIRDVFAKQYEDKVVLVDQSAITATGRSTACTYLGFFDDIRKLFGDANKVDPGLFSFNGKGKCSVCNGHGFLRLSLFLWTLLLRFAKNVKASVTVSRR